VGQYVRVAPGSLYHGWVFQNGVYRKGWLDGWLQGTGWPSIVLQTWQQHAHYDEYWRDQDLSTHLDQVHWPMFYVAGWFDVFSQGTIDAFTQVQENGGDGARGRQHLLIGPWVHGDIWAGGFGRKAGVLTFPPNAAKPPGVVDTFTWLSFWLTGQPDIPADEPSVRYYVMGDVSDPQAPGNLWRAADRWPPPSRPLRLYFTADGGLDRQPPATSSVREYDYDPTQPVRSRGGQNISIDAGPLDQRPIEGRPDVLVFSTPPLAEPLEVTGRISVRLYASTSARDTDFTAKLTDVYPDGRSMLVTDGIVRARYRRSLETEEMITLGERAAYDIDLWSTSIVFNRGHQIRVAISSSNAPRFEPNPNTGGSWPFDPSVSSVVAHQMIALGGAEASQIILPEVVGGGMP
jgi:putative CocE/NonD family hydrolase